MKRILLLVLVAAAAWYGWKNWPALLQRVPGHEAVIENRSGFTMTRIRLLVDGQTLVREELPDGQKAVLPFRVERDAAFEMSWQWRERMGERHWQGGMVPRGPMVQRHVFLVDAEGEVLYRAEPK